jgi:tellurite resistance protein
MSFLDSLMNRPVSPYEAAVTCAVAVLTLSGEFTDLERRIISLFRDQFPPLSRVQETDFTQLVEKGIALVQNQGAVQDVRQFVQMYLAPAITPPQDRIAAYRYAYALAMANLNVDEGEQALLDEMKTGLGLDQASCEKAEQEALAEYAPMHRALAAVVLGFILVTADGQIYQEELDALKNSRNLLEPIARLDDQQFVLIYDLGLSIYNRFLLDPENRSAFLYNIVAPKLDNRDLRVQGFHYAASVCTADGDVAQAEVDVMKELLQALQLKDAVGEAIFNQYMGRVKTIDGHPLTPQ